MVSGAPVSKGEAKIVIDIASGFSAYPSGRFEADGQFNGELFRTKCLVPALAEVAKSDSNDVVVVDIDGVRTFGSSFLEEAFAGLIRLRLFDKRFVQTHLVIRCSKSHLLFFKKNIEELIASAVPSSASLN
jgi:hypothetical protein